jgi:hypothetical protein
MVLPLPWVAGEMGPGDGFFALAVHRKKTHHSRSRVGFIPQGNTDFLAAIP